MNDAFVEMAKDMLVEAKRQNKRLFLCADNFNLYYVCNDSSVLHLV